MLNLTGRWKPLLLKKWYMSRSLYCAVALIAAAVCANAQDMVPLSEAIEIALENNYDIKLSRNDATAAETDKQYIVGAFLPQINLVGSRVWNSNDQKQRLPDNTERERNDIKSDNLTGSAQLSWLLFDGTRMFAAKNRVEEIAEQGELLVKNEMVNTVASVINNYYFIVALKQQLKATREQMAVSEERVKLADLKLQVGTGGKPELLQAKVDLNAQRTQVLTQEMGIQRLKDQLNGLLGMKLPPVFEVADTIIIDLSLTEEQIANEMATSNYSLLAAEKNVEISNFALRERRGELFPFLYFNSNYNFSRTQNEVAINNFTPLFNQNKGFNYGFSVSFPILTGLNTRREVRQAHLTIERQELLFEQLKISLGVEVQNAFDNYQAAKEVLVIEEQNILLAKENVFIALEGFKRGITTFIELRTAQQSLEDAYTRLITARYDAKVAEVNLLRLSGRLIRG